MGAISQTTFSNAFYWNKTVRISIKISLKLVPKDPNYNIPALIQIMAWCRPGDKPLSEPMLVSLLTHRCVTRPLWVKEATVFNPFRYIGCLFYGWTGVLNGYSKKIQERPDVRQGTNWNIFGMLWRTPWIQGRFFLYFMDRVCYHSTWVQIVSCTLSDDSVLWDSTGLFSPVLCVSQWNLFWQKISQWDCVFEIRLGLEENGSPLHLVTSTGFLKA